MANPTNKPPRSQDSQKAKRESGFLTPEEIAVLLRVPDRRTLQGKRDFALLLLMVSSGLRASEVCGLSVGDIETYRSQRVLRVFGKGQKTRLVPIHSRALGAIRAYWDAAGLNGQPDDAPVFRNLGLHGPYEAGRLTYKAIRHLVSRASIAALIKKKTSPHVLRHTFAVSLLDQGVDLRTVQDLMGHASITTTQAYLHTSDEKKLAAVNALTFGS